MRFLRISKDEWYMGMAFMCAARSTCRMRAVGCILVNDNGHVIGTGYNGNYMGAEHCIDRACEGYGRGIWACEAIHAEQNAFLQCNDSLKTAVGYVTTFPCIACMKLFLNTFCKELVYCYESRHSLDAIELWKSSGRKIKRIDKPKTINFDLRT